MLFLLILFLHLGIKTEYDCGQIRRGVGVSINKTSIVSYKRNIISHKHGKSRGENEEGNYLLTFEASNFGIHIYFIPKWSHFSNSSLSHTATCSFFFLCNCVPLFEAKGECSK